MAAYKHQGNSAEALEGKSVHTLQLDIGDCGVGVGPIHHSIGTQLPKDRREKRVEPGEVSLFLLEKYRPMSYPWRRQ